MRLTKHHGLGNDFLVAVAPRTALSADDARRLCDRRRGIGADGLIEVGAPRVAGADVSMHLFNSDGSVAEMSGNGIRCLAHAVALERGDAEATYVVETAAGLRRVHLSAGPEPERVLVRVEMGRVVDGPIWRPSRAAHDLVAELSGEVPVAVGTADVGNPHLVVLVPAVERVAVGHVGPVLEADFPAGVNVEFIAPSRACAGHLDLVVWERGAGVTEACGTGACAAATLAHRWGLVGDHVAVHMPGGDVTVEVGETTVLVGPSVYIGQIEVDVG